MVLALMEPIVLLKIIVQIVMVLIPITNLMEHAEMVLIAMELAIMNGHTVLTGIEEVMVVVLAIMLVMVMVLVVMELVLKEHVLMVQIVMVLVFKEHVLMKQI